MKKEALQKCIHALLEEKSSQEEIYSKLLNEGFFVNDIQEALEDRKHGSKKEDNQKRTIEIIITIGAILIGLGVFSFIASNWQDMTRGIKVFILVFSMLASYGVGFYLEEKTGLKKSAYGLYLLGAILYGAGIFLIGQMYHLPLEWPEGFIVWMMGNIAFLMIKPFAALAFLAIGTGFIGSLPFLFEDAEMIWGFGNSIFSMEFILLLGFIFTFVYGFKAHKKIRKQLTNMY